MRFLTTPTTTLLYVLISCLCMLAIASENTPLNITDTNTMQKIEDEIIEKAKNNLVASLDSFGYREGTDFSALNLELNDLSKHYVVPHYAVTIVYNANTRYIPYGKKINFIYSQSFAVVDSIIEERTPNYGSSYGYGYSTLSHEPVALTDNGFFPGLQYFKKELEQLNASLLKNKPIVKRDRAELSFEKGLENLIDKGLTIYQLSNKRFFIQVYITDFPDMYSGLQFEYDAESGNVTNVGFISPPALA